MSDISNATLLLVDDEEEIRSILREYLAPITNHIFEAANGVEALALIRSGKIDAVISDISMPKMTGLQMLAELRHSGSQIPFVILTAYADKKNILEALRLDATDFLEKPFDRERVVTVTRTILDLGQQLNAMEQEIDAVFNHLDLPADQAARVKKLKKVLQGMRLSSKVYSEKKPT